MLLVINYIFLIIFIPLIFIQIIKGKSIKVFSYLILWDMALNGLFKDAFNWLFQRDGYNFGNTSETISSALGKNQIDNTLTLFGRFMCWFLHILDKNHCIESINENVTNARVSGGSYYYKASNRGFQINKKKQLKRE